MVWKSCQKRFEEEIDFETNFVFERYVADGVHYEHGQQYEQVNHIEEEELFLSDGLKEPILNLPWGTHFVINFLIGLKKERPAVDKVRPISAFMRWSLVFDFWWFFKTLIRVFLYFFATRFSKSIYRTSHLKTTFKIIKDISQRPSLTLAARKLLEADESIHTVIMGHTHVPKYVQFPDGREYLNTGTWTEVTSLNLDTLGKHTRYTYVYVDYSSPKNRPYARLKEWKGRWHSDIDVYVGSLDESR